MANLVLYKSPLLDYLIMGFIYFWVFLFFKFHKEYIALAISKCFTIKQLLWIRWCLSPVLNVSQKHWDFMHHCASIQVQTCCCW